MVMRQSKIGKTQIFGIRSNGDLEMIGEIDDFLKGAFHIWKNIGNKYGIKLGFYQGVYGIFVLIDREDVSINDKIMIESTLGDVVYLKENNLSLLLESYAQYCDDFEGSNVPEQLEIIQGRIMNDDDLIGVCFNQSSHHSFNIWNEEYNINKDSGHWYSMMMKE